MVIDALGTAPKGLERRLEEMEIKGRVETIQTTDCVSLDFFQGVGRGWPFLSF